MWNIDSVGKHVRKSAWDQTSIPAVYYHESKTEIIGCLEKDKNREFLSLQLFLHSGFSMVSFINNFSLMKESALK